MRIPPVHYLTHAYCQLLGVPLNLFHSGKVGAYFNIGGAKRYLLPTNSLFFVTIYFSI